jgi:Tfp pilus assembly protein PilF
MLFLLSCFLLSCQTPLEQAQLALGQHDLVLAEQHFREAIQLDPNNPKAIAGLGWTYHIALEKMLAAQSFERCLQIDKQNVECMRGRASVALAQQEFQVAEHWLKQAHGINADDPELQLSMALLELSQGEHEVALLSLEAMTRRFPLRSEFRLTYAETLLRNKRFEEALKETETVLNDESLLPRYQAMCWMLRVRILLEGSSIVLERSCVQKGEVWKWVSEAERSLERAKSIGISIPNLAVVQRQIARRKNDILSKCPNSFKKKD